MNCLVIILLFVTFPLAVYGQRLEYWGEPALYIQEQARNAFQLIDASLDINLPGDTSLNRKMDLVALDHLFHDVKIDSTDVSVEFMTNRTRKILKKLEQPMSGTVVYKIYNHGFIVRSGRRTIAFDLVRGCVHGHQLIADSLMVRLVQHCDALFISHLHGDHADTSVGKLFLKSNKYVVVPNGVWSQNTNNHLLHLRSDKILRKKINAFDVAILPGHQGKDVLNNIYVVTFPNGITVAQTGDQANEQDAEWLSHVRDEIPKVDILMVNCWLPDLQKVVRGVAPALICSGHENELGHSIDHREAYWLSYMRFQDVPFPCVIMGWGECYSYTSSQH